MAYYDVALLAQDVDFMFRVTACYATETVDDDDAEIPNAWATTHAWELAAQPGFGDAYAYALANGNPAPGRDPAVITDAMILGAVQPMINAPADEGG